MRASAALSASMAPKIGSGHLGAAIAGTMATVAAAPAVRAPRNIERRSVMAFVCGLPWRAPSGKPYPIFRHAHRLSDSELQTFELVVCHLDRMPTRPAIGRCYCVLE
jgi:hypothetical protein